MPSLACEPQIVIAASINCTVSETLGRVIMGHEIHADVLDSKPAFDLRHVFQAGITMSEQEPTLKELRERAHLTQSEVAELIGTSQQTVDRIERGATEQSRYEAPMRAVLKHTIDLQMMVSAEYRLSEGRAYQLHQNRAPLMTLEADGRLVAEDKEVQLHLSAYKDDELNTYAVQLTKPQRGPAGDPVFRARDILAVTMDAMPRHFDWVLVSENERARLVMVIDPAEMPPSSVASDLRGLGYEVLDDDAPSSMHRVIGRYMF